MIDNFINGAFRASHSTRTLPVVSPLDGSVLAELPCSTAADLDIAVQAAAVAFPGWSGTPIKERVQVFYRYKTLLERDGQELAALISRENGKTADEGAAEIGKCIELAEFATSLPQLVTGEVLEVSRGIECRTEHVPLGIVACIVPFNFPAMVPNWTIPNALALGNCMIIKPSEKVPLTLQRIAALLKEAGLPDGVLNVVQGLGPEAGAALVEHGDVDLVSFTGSAATGRWINEAAGKRLAKVCLELGGKNALVVCDDADLDTAVRWALASAFSNAGQRCASASRIVVFDSVYDDFREPFLAGAAEYDAGPVISEDPLDRLVAAGAKRLDRPGYWVAPTVLEDVAPDAEVSCAELFGPVTILYRVRGFDEAVALVNDSPYGLTAAIHTASVHRAMSFAEQARAGVVVVNGGTHGSEPHMGFGGVKQSGTGWREAGVEALDVYSDWKYVNLITDPAHA